MSNIDTVYKYMKAFYADFNPEILESILDGNLAFEGPFYKFSSANNYINSLRTNPPVEMSFKIIESFESGNKVALLYEFSKSEIRTPMAQFFTFEAGKITSIKLVFDTRVFFSDGER